MGSAFRSPALRRLTPLFFFLFSIQIATAFPCERFGWFTSCDVVMHSSLSDEEKMETIASMIDDVHKWNTNFEVDVPPENTNVVSNDVVSNAWVRIMAVMPSVYEGNSILSPGFGEVVAKSNYEIAQPYGVEQDDCDTHYNLQHQSRIVQYLNGQQIGIGEDVQFNSNNSVFDFRADLIVDAALEVRHYRWEQVDNETTCVYDNTEVRNSQLVTSDNLRASRHQPNITYSFKVENEYYGITQVHFNATNYSWFRVQFNDNNFYEERLVEFDRFFTLEPYDILNFKPHQHSTVEFNGVRYQNDTFQVTSTQGCKILLGDYFRTYTIPCPLNYQPTNLKISTDKDVYSDGELITVNIDPSDIPVQVSYGNVSATVSGSWQVPANLNEHLITASANGVVGFHAIYVSNPSIWQTAWRIIGLFAVALIFWRIVTRLLGGAYDLWNS